MPCRFINILYYFDIFFFCVTNGFEYRNRLIVKILLTDAFNTKFHVKMQNFHVNELNFNLRCICEFHSQSSINWSSWLEIYYLIVGFLHFTLFVDILID